MKKFLAIFASAFAMLFAFISSSFADVYRMGSGTTSALGTAAKDTADSLVFSLGDLLPVFIPLIVVGFIIGLVMYFIHKRG